MKKILLFSKLVLVALVLTSCASNKIQNDANYKEVADPLKSLLAEANTIIEQGGLAAVGEGTSVRRDIARQKARTSAEGELAQLFDRKVEQLRKNFIEEVGQGQRSEINELFSNTQKTLTVKTLTGAQEKNYKILQNNSGQYLCGVLIVLNPEILEKQIEEDLEENKQLYQRFRSSKAFEMLKKEIEEYKKTEEN